MPRPTMRIANTGNAISALLLLYNPLQAKVTRIQTCKKFLDAVNFTGGTNATADPTAKFEDQIFTSTELRPKTRSWLSLS